MVMTWKVILMMVLLPLNMMEKEDENTRLGV